MPRTAIICGMVQVRHARPEDAAAMGDIHVRAWQAAYRGLMPEGYLTGLVAVERAAMWKRRLDQSIDRASVFVAELDGGVVGFAATGPARNATGAEDDGELYAINVDPDHWSSGAGTALLDAVVQDLSQHGFHNMILWVHPENQRARGFYKRAGWTCDGTSRNSEVLGVVVPELRYRRPGR